LSLTLAPIGVRAAVTTFENPSFGVVDTPIMIDATNFINFGTFNIVTPTPVFLTHPQLPFETFDTLNFTNFGPMTSQNGWRFVLNDNATGQRRMAANFVNFNPGAIRAVDPGA